MDKKLFFVFQEPPQNKTQIINKHFLKNKLKLFTHFSAFQSKINFPFLTDKETENGVQEP